MDWIWAPHLLAVVPARRLDPTRVSRNQADIADARGEEFQTACHSCCMDWDPPAGEAGAAETSAGSVASSRLSTDRRAVGLPRTVVGHRDEEDVGAGMLQAGHCTAVSRAEVDGENVSVMSERAALACSGRNGDARIQTGDRGRRHKVRERPVGRDICSGRQKPSAGPLVG